MREILFRGKRINNGDWTYGNLIVTKRLIGTECYVSTQNGIDNGKSYKFSVNPSTVGQYTGLIDKNGKKIFEGDICNINIPRIDGGFSRHNKCLCFYEDGMYKFSSYSDIYFCMGNGYGYPDTCHQNIEAIGNIHDNPELLEVTE